MLKMLQSIKLAFSSLSVVAAFAGCSRARLPVANNMYQKEGTLLSGQMNSTNQGLPTAPPGVLKKDLFATMRSNGTRSLMPGVKTVY